MSRVFTFKQKARAFCPLFHLSFPLAFSIAICQYVDMVCIQCGGKTQVINSRHQKRTNRVWRRRKCQLCGAVFTSEESAAYSASWAVKSPSGALKPFSRDKLFLSIHRSLQHRPTALEDAAGLADTAIKKLSDLVADGVIESRVITYTVQIALNRFDQAASTHYAAFHK
jgi:transcriptional regulator NrdR family protein